MLGTLDLVGVNKALDDRLVSPGLLGLTVQLGNLTKALDKISKALWSFKRSLAFDLLADSPGYDTSNGLVGCSLF